MSDHPGYGSTARGRLVRILPTAILIAALCLSVVIWEFSRQRGQELARVEFEQLVTRVGESIARRIVANEQVLRSVEGLFDASNEVSRGEFRAFVAALGLEKSYPGIQGVGFSKLIPPQALPAHLREVRGEGFPNYEVRPPGERELYTAIVYLEPFDWRNQRAFGYDMYSEPVRREAMRRAAETGTAALSGKVTLLQETENDKQAGVLLYVPIYAGTEVPKDAEGRRRLLVGWAYSPLRMKNLINGLLAREHGDLADRIAFRIHDGRGEAPETLLFDSAGDATLAVAPFVVKRSLTVGGREWTLVAMARPAFVDTHGDHGRKALLVAELAITWLVTLLALTVLSHHRRQAAAMNSLTDANREIEQRRNWLQSIFDASTVGIFLVDDKGVITMANQRMGEMFGCRPEALQGAEYVSLLHPLEREAGRTAMRALLERRSDLVDVDRRYWRSDHSEFWGHISGRRVMGADGQVSGLVGVIEDITPRRDAERALRQSEERYRIIAENSSDVIWLMDLATQRFTYVSPSVQRMRGWTAEEIIAQPTEAAVTPDSAEMFRERLQRRMERLAAGDASARFNVSEMDQPCKDGRVICTEVASSVLFDEAGRPTQLLGITRDITERKRAEAELEGYRSHLEELVAQRTEDLARALEAAETASRAKSVFLANMSHELRTPLNAIMGMTNLAMRRISDARVADNLNTGLKAARHLLELIDNLLDIANFEAGRLTLAPAPFSVAGLVDESLQMQDVAAREKGLQLAAEIAAEVPDLLIGDARRLRQILLNFLSNAVKFSERGEIRLLVSMQGEDPDGVLLRFEVSDQGMGLTPEAREKLFQLFSQGDDASTRIHGGAGLGLVIARRIAALMGGEVGADGREGEGSRFWVTVRLKRG